jgi:iron(III) transport system ATP-binding protein
MIRVEGLTKTFKASKETVAAVAGIDFEVAAGEMVTLLGPSGCGKTTTLRCVAGLERPDGGRISIGDRAVVDIEAGVFMPPHHRNIGMVFQSYAIWPHMTVLENVAYALEGKRFSRAERRRLAMEALSVVKLAELADRPAPRLSGGQQQRVAIARAIWESRKCFCSTSRSRISTRGCGLRCVTSCAVSSARSGSARSMSPMTRPKHSRSPIGSW